MSNSQGQQRFTWNPPQYPNITNRYQLADNGQGGTGLQVPTFAQNQAAGRAAVPGAPDWISQQMGQFYNQPAVTDPQIWGRWNWAMPGSQQYYQQNGGPRPPAPTPAVPGNTPQENMAGAGLAGGLSGTAPQVAGPPAPAMSSSGLQLSGNQAYANQYNPSAGSPMTLRLDPAGNPQWYDAMTGKTSAATAADWAAQRALPGAR